MDRRWLAFAAVVGAAAATVVLTTFTADTPVPVLGIDGFDHVTAERTLSDAAAVLAAEPDTDLAGLVDDHPTLIDVEGREPAGVLFAGVALVAVIIGTLALRARNPYGRLLVAFGLVAAGGGVARALADLAVHSTPSRGAVWAQIAFAIADTVWIPLGVVLGPLLLLTLPNGELPSRARRWVVVASVVAAGLLAAVLLHPLRYDGRALAPYRGVDASVIDAVYAIAVPLWMIVLTASAISVVVRFRRSTGSERQQLKWMVWAVGVSVGLLLASDLAQTLGGDARLWGPVAAAGFMVTLPLAFVASLLRLGLLGIDLVIDKTLVYGALSALIALVYVAVITVAGSVIGERGVPASLLAMLVAAVLVEPLRQRVARSVDRFVWRRGSDPAEAVGRALTFVERPVSTDEGLDAILDSTAVAVNAAAVALWERRGGRHELIRSVAREAGPLSPDRLTLVLRARAGALGVLMRPGDRLRRDEKLLVQDLAAVAFGLMENARLCEELDQVLRELTERRDELDRAEQRLRAVVGETSRAVERDLHDGAQARAVSLAASIGLARAAPHTSHDLAADIDSARRSVVDFANGLHPEHLRRTGIAEALVDLANRVVPGAAVRCDVGDVDAEVATVAYMVASEAMVNSARHARGSTRHVTCRSDHRRLVLVVSDDGPGFSPASVVSGSGLGNLRERVEGLGGRLLISTGPSAGTRVEADLPLQP